MKNNFFNFMLVIIPFIFWLLPWISLDGRSLDLIFIIFEMAIGSSILLKYKSRNLVAIFISILIFMIFDEVLSFRRASYLFAKYTANHEMCNYDESLKKDGWVKSGYIYFKYVHGYGAAWKIVYQASGGGYFIQWVGKNQFVDCR